MTGGNDNHIADKHRSPNVMFRSLLMMAAIISVPSVLPFAERASLWQLPHSNDIIYHNIRNLVCHYPDNAVCQYLHDLIYHNPGNIGENPDLPPDSRLSCLLPVLTIHVYI